ncbi:NirD/YgiW/YdeI family stress tolerance protein [Paraburkholderia terricola]|uniref:Uncharacterized protein (TIGR00156 family) n=1 Tax=Paraburkholderia terricola TaxID=169427 RepID=A0ABU1LW48_9BURK|nr:NirD/YgiW/YdeI family stress tolerance protein [Paraburkholderia terricola]MDR6410978.1 uncharacterized protein (TIGR00156 family) [Paraburkholderia terricola]MDR6483341.1 uncharacterized protein (TIGR00156 family) [Paraburkholderia terricola]
MKKMIVACLLAAPAIGAQAQYTGPGAEPTATSVKQLLDGGRDDQSVVLRGRLVKQLGGDRYQFADSTGQIQVDIDHRRWPAGQPISDTSLVELRGEYDKELVGTSEVDVHEIRVIK